MNNLPHDIPGLARGNPEIIRALEQALAAAKSGQLVGAALVLVTGSELLSAQTVGAFPATMIAGCELVKQSLLNNMTGGGRKPSSILQLRQ